jgi:hypothetical protein
VKGEGNRVFITIYYMAAGKDMQEGFVAGREHWIPEQVGNDGGKNGFFATPSLCSRASVQNDNGGDRDCRASRLRS